MPPRLRLLFSIMNVTLFVIAALPIYRELTRRRDIWWTPVTMLVPFAEGEDRVQIYVRREPLAALVHAGQLRMVEDKGSTVLASSDVSLRFNNWERVRSDHMALVLTCAAMCGIAATMFLLTLTGRLAYRGDVTR